MDLQVTTPRLKRESLLEDWENKLSEFLDQNSDSDLVQIEEVFFLKKKRKKNTCSYQYKIFLQHSLSWLLAASLNKSTKN